MKPGAIKAGISPNQPVVCQDTRAYGVDILRLVSMLMVVVLHIAVIFRFSLINLGNPPIAPFSIHIQESLSIVAVNLFSIISGYLLAEKSFKISSFIRLYVEVIFYTIGITFVWQFISDDAARLGWKYALTSLNFADTQYWYFNAYAFVFFSSPIFNKVGKCLTQGQFLYFLISTAMISCVLGWNEGGHLAGSGHNAFWLSYMYMCGMYIKKYPIRIHWLTCVAIYAACTSLLILLRNGGMYERHLFREYDSPILLVSSLSLFLALYRIQVKSRIAKRLLNFITPSAFAVYLIHCHKTVWNAIEEGCTEFLHGGGEYSFVPVFLISIGLFLVCIFIDLVRRFFFHTSSLNKILSTCSTAVDKKILLLFPK